MRFMKIRMVLLGLLFAVFFQNFVYAEELETIKIGVNLELTGKGKSYGISSLEGVQIAAAEYNAQGGFKGRKLELVVVDNQSEESGSVLGMKKLVESRVVAVVGPAFSSPMIAAAPVNDESKVLGISGTASNPRVTLDENGKVRPFLFTLSSNDWSQGAVMATFATRSLKAQTAVIYIDNNSDYSKRVAINFEKKFIQAGGIILSKERYQQEDKNFKETLLKIKATKADVIFIPGYYQEVGLIIKQSRELGIKSFILGGDGWDAPSLSMIAGKENVENTFFCNDFSTKDTNLKVTKFVEEYRKKNGKEPDSFGALSYDATWLIINAMERADSTEPIKIRDEMENTKEYDGVTGRISIHTDHQAEKSIVVNIFRDGKPVFYERVDLFQ